VRDFLPWHIVRQKLAARGVVFKDDPNDDPPPSGVRMSDKDPGNDVRSEPEPQPEVLNDEGLSFKVYTLADLEKRHGDSVPPVIRPSMAALAASPKPPAAWLPAAKALLAVVYTLKTWALMGKGRPPVRDALRAPGVVLGLELRTLSSTVDWKRLAVGVSAGLGTAIVLLFAVLTVADLTDDLKPARTDGAPSMMMPPAAAAPSLPAAEPTFAATPAPPPADVTPAAVAAGGPIDELDGVVPPPADVTPARAAPSHTRRPKKAAKKKKSEVFNP
jgi:hypothetical protein